MFDGADAIVGPLVASRLTGRAQKLAISSKLSRLHRNGFDIGDNAVVGLSVDEVRDPNNPQITFQPRIQDMVSRSLEAFFQSKRGKLKLQEYSVERDLRYDEPETRKRRPSRFLRHHISFVEIQNGSPNGMMVDALMVGMMLSGMMLSM